MKIVLTLVLTCVIVATVLALVLAFAPLSALRIIGYTVAGLTSGFLLGWAGVAAGTWAQVTDVRGDTVHVDWEKELLGQWEAVASSPTFRWESPDCDSTARYTLLGNGTIEVQNTCYNTKTGQVQVAVGKAAVTKKSGVLAVSFFPGVFAAFVVRDKNTDGTLLVVTDRLQEVGWLLRKKVTRPTETEEFVARLEKLVGPVQRRHELREVTPG